MVYKFDQKVFEVKYALIICALGIVKCINLYVPTYFLQIVTNVNTIRYIHTLLFLTTQKFVLQ